MRLPATEIAVEPSRFPQVTESVTAGTPSAARVTTSGTVEMFEKIVGIKEASDSLDRLVGISRINGLALYSGNDSQIYPVLSLGGLGVISVVSNLYPEETIDICKQYFANNEDKSLDLQKSLLPVINALFLETNPSPVKYAMSKKGLCKADMRLPMWLPTKVTRDKIDGIIEAYEKKKRKQ